MTEKKWCEMSDKEFAAEKELLLEALKVAAEEDAKNPNPDAEDVVRFCKEEIAAIKARVQERFSIAQGSGTGTCKTCEHRKLWNPKDETYTGIPPICHKCHEDSEEERVANEGRTTYPEYKPDFKEVTHD